MRGQIHPYADVAGVDTQLLSLRNLNTWLCSFDSHPVPM